MSYDAVLLISFGGPEKREDVIPFLENVLRGRNVPHDRLLEVAEHYYHFDGRSPINDQCRDLIRMLGVEGLELPIYWGNRNWYPMLAGTVKEMRDAGVERALAIPTSAFGSYSGCRQYLEDIDAVRNAVPNAPVIDKLPPFWNHAGFIETMVDRVSKALEKLPGAQVVYTAHSIPVSMAQSSPYESQLKEAARRVNDTLNLGEPILVYQSRSGPPTQPWLEPDVCESIRQLHAGGDLADLVLAPIGFLSDHMEVVYDLDIEAAALCRELGINLARATTVGIHPAFVSMIRELILERMEGREERRLGRAGAGRGTCGPDCCPPPKRPPVKSAEAR